MKTMTKLLLFTCLVLLLVSIVSATESVSNATVTTEHACEVADDTPGISQQDTLIQQDANKNTEKNEKTDIPEDIKTRNEINKNIKNKNIKEESVSVKSWDTLASAVNNSKSATEDTTIILEDGTYINTGTITWNYTGIVLTIDGNGQTIDGNQTQVFYIKSGCSLILKNITITNAKANDGGAIYNEGNLTLSNSVLHNNTAKWNGGAINTYKGTITITNTTLNNNTAKWNGGAIYNYNGTITITNNTNINNNNATFNGGAIHNQYGTITITNNTNINNNNATYDGGAIYNWYGTITINNTTLNNNKATYGGAIYNEGSKYTTAYNNVNGSDFTNNNASYGAAIYTTGNTIGNITFNNFTRNTATGNKETLDLNGIMIVKNNTYNSTDISLKTINLTVKDNRETFQYHDDVELIFSIELTNPDNYDSDILEKIDKTIYINNTENATTNSTNYTLSNPYIGKYTAYYTTCNQKSDIANFKVIGKSEITTDKESYDYYDGINNKITLQITDDSEQKGTITISVKDGEEYTKLSSHPNMKNESTISTKMIAETLGNIYNNLNSTYTINITYNSNDAYVNPSSTEFTLNIIKLRNTSIIYKVINNTEGNVQINITVIDKVYNTPIPDARIEITGAITKNTTTGILTDDKLLKGDYSINVKFNQTEDYKTSKTTIDFTVEIDKDKKIAELEKEIENLTTQLDEANNQITSLNNTIKNLNNQLENANNKITELNNTINKLTQQLKEANNKITEQNNTINNLTTQLDKANNQITELNNTINKLTQQLKEANNKITEQNNTINKLTQQLKEANNKITEQNDKIENLTTQLEEANTQINSLNDTINTLTQQLEETNSEIAEQNNTINDLNSQLDEAEEEIQDLKDTINELLKVTDTTITINPIKSSIGSIATLTANITDANGNKVSGGKAVFKVNGITLKDETGNVIYARVSDGSASITYKVPDVWMKDTSYVEAVYSGTQKYTSSRTKSTDALQITPGTAKITLDKDTITAKSGETITLRAEVFDTTGDRINSGKVVFKLNGKTLKDENGNTLYARVIDGEASLDYTIPAIYSAKAYTLTAVFGGGNYERSETTGTLTLERKAVNIKENNITTVNGKTTIKATITDETGKLLVTNTKLAIKINKKTILNNVTSSNGKIDVSFTIPLRPGSYELEIISGENSIYKKGTLTTVLKI